VVSLGGIIYDDIVNIVADEIHFNGPINQKFETTSLSLLSEVLVEANNIYMSSESEIHAGFIMLAANETVNSEPGAIISSL